MTFTVHTKSTVEVQCVYAQIHTRSATVEPDDRLEYSLECKVYVLQYKKKKKVQPSHAQATNLYFSLTAF